MRLVITDLLSEWVAEWCSGGVHNAGRGEFGMAAGVESDVPSLPMHYHMVVLT
jgi:hypothetical protein